MLNILMKATQHPQEAAVKTRLFTHRQHSDRWPLTATMGQAA